MTLIIKLIIEGTVDFKNKNADIVFTAPKYGFLIISIRQ